MKSIGDYAFSGCSSLTSIYIPYYSVTSIGHCAFYRCDSLKSINIPESVTSIGDEAFWGCTLTPLRIDNADAIQQTSLTGLNESSIILVPTVKDVEIIKPYFKGEIYANSAAYAIKSL